MIRPIIKPTPAQTASFEFCESDSVYDSDWDAFLADYPAGHHVQSSLWASVKALNGWTVKRITILLDGRIVGGAQMLIRQVKFLGAVGYVPKGPVLSNDDPLLAEQVLMRLCELAKSTGLRLLILQPPEFNAVTSRLTEQGFASCPVETAPSATLLVDLSVDSDAILRRMPKGMRNQVRRGQNRGIECREGGKADLPVFHRLLTTTSQRRGFSTFELEYFQGMWDILARHDGIKLFLSELGSEPVSAQLCIPFGDTIVAKQIGWSGEHRRLHPNEALDWFTIQWAKDNGYRYYDLEGIERPAAAALVAGKPLPAEYAGTPTAYKLRLGGDVHLYPGAFCHFANPLLRSLYNRVGYQVAGCSIFQKAIGRFRTS